MREFLLSVGFVSSYVECLSLDARNSGDRAGTVVDDSYAGITGYPSCMVRRSVASEK
jgi:hypothetical protein